MRSMMVTKYGKKQQEEIFSWTKRLVRQVVHRILDTVLWPSPVNSTLSGLSTKSLPNLKIDILNTMG